MLVQLFLEVPTNNHSKEPWGPKSAGQKRLLLGLFFKDSWDPYLVLPGMIAYQLM